MRLSAPRNALFFISVCLIILGLLASLVAIPFFSGINNWVSFAGGALLTLGCLLKGI
jgi:phosphotransferase system  glucose/maltose/N-acetylglucosamine-specific IIC component